MKTKRNANAFMLILIIYSFAAAVMVGGIINWFDIKSVATTMGLVQVLTFGVPCAAVLLTKRQDWRELVPLRLPGWGNVVFILVLMLFAQPLMMLCSGLSMLLFENEIAATVGDMYTDDGILVTLLVVGVCPSILEELAFRGIILSGYKRSRPFVAALVNGIFFGIIHLSPQQFLYAFLLGMVFSYMVYYTRTILSGMLAHFVCNSSQVLLSYFTGANAETEATTTALADVPAEMQPFIDWMTNNPVLLSVIVMFVISLVAGPVFYAVFRLFISYNQKRNAAADALAVEGAAETEEPARNDTPFNWMFWCVVAIYVLFVFAIMCL